MFLAVFGVVFMKIKRIAAVLLVLVMAVAPVAVFAVVAKADAETFVPRLNAPHSTNPYYYSDKNIFYKYGFGMPNCTAYAWGRAYELLGESPKLSVDSAHYWWGYNKDGGYYPYGDEPRLGAIACWNNSSGGHVAVVEKIEDGVITFSNSGYGYKNFYLTTCDYLAPNDGSYNENWSFYGYIYILDTEGSEDYYESLGGDVYRIRSSNGVNLRAGAGTSYRVLTAIPDNTLIVVKEVNFQEGYTWGKVSYEGFDGWCVLDFAELIYEHQGSKEESTTTPESAELLGDADGDGKVTIQDVSAIQKYSAKVELSKPFYEALADFNGDGKISVSDASKVQKYIAGII